MATRKEVSGIEIMFVANIIRIQNENKTIIYQFMHCPITI